MKKIFTTLFLAGIFLSAQSQVLVPAGPLNNYSEVAPMAQTAKGGTHPSTQAVFDLQFQHDLSLHVAGGNAGIIYINGEFWTSRWAQDTVWRFDTNGALLGHFILPNAVSGQGARAFTTDGTNVYASKNSNVIQIINPNTYMPTGTITSSSAVAIRTITYDATANGGAGGFWISNFGTDIVLISMTGSVLATIPAAVHGLTGMYGSAVDNTSSGGPYLWVSNQPGNPGAEIYQLELPSGIVGTQYYDINTNLGTATGLGGGIFYTSGLAAAPTLLTLLQGTPNYIIGFEAPSTVGVDEVNDDFSKSVSVFPSPAYSTVFVNHTANGESLIQIFDVTGKIVFETKSLEQENKIDVSKLTNGIYSVKVSTENGIGMKKFMKY
ncbi:MAG TPA: T9SS type A sorting domain-containing protein [Bacteroidia bacterium]|nr:T9SS type A sorting domain-containing protein [Bacteroidia bacterium]HNT80677.1 T9SS type A sorting domain-containing protein [Bacteroidia bacterium]